MGLYCRVPSSWFADPSLCWFEWQTLIGGFLALLGALLTVKVVLNQINQAETSRREELSQRHNAARAIMPLVLSEISEFCLKAATTIANEIEARGFDDETDWTAQLAAERNPQTLPSPHFPHSAVSALQPFIETLKDSSDVRHVAELIASLQILTSRYGSVDLHHFATVQSLYGLLVDSAKARLLAHAIFNYARFLDNKPFGLVGRATNRQMWDEIRGEAHGLLFARANCDRFFPEIDSRIESYKERDYTPWNEKFDR